MRTIVAILVVLSLSGCAQWKASARISPQSVAEYSSPPRQENGFKQENYNCNLTYGPHDTRPGAVNLDCFKFPENRTEPNSLTAYARAAGAVSKPTAGTVAVPPSPTDTKLARDRLTGVLLKHADDVCVVEKGRLLATQTTANFGLSFLTTALSATSTIVVGEQAKTILSGLAAVSSGTQDNVNATFYQNQLTQAITKSIDAERTKLLTAITVSRASSTDDYSVDEMIRAANEYHQACSFEKGLQLLLEAAVDSSGANAAQQFRAGQAAQMRVRNRILELRRSIATDKGLGLDVTALTDQLAEAEAALHGLEMAGVASTAKGESPAEAEKPVDQSAVPPKT